MEGKLKDEEEEEAKEEEEALAKIRSQLEADPSAAVLLQAQLEVQAIEDLQEDDEYAAEEAGEEYEDADEVHQRQQLHDSAARGMSSGLGIDQYLDDEFDQDYEDSDEPEDDGPAGQGATAVPVHAKEALDEVGVSEMTSEMENLDDAPFHASRVVGAEEAGARGEERKVFVVQLDDGSLYEGEGFGVIPDGFGSETYPDGSTYEGQFVNGQRSGLGAYYFTNRRIYEGQWNSGVRDGTGVERYEHTLHTKGSSDDDDLEIRKPTIVTYKEGGLIMRKPLESNASVVSTLMMDVVDAVEAARAASRDARAVPF